jgi:hyperosmotically inducible periplasmic protein
MRVKTAFLTILLGAALGSAQAQSPDPGTKPDNTKVNKRDRNAGEATADQQKMNNSDRDLTRKIRQSIMADKSLSTYAHNVKVISQNGSVTLKGPVRSEDEKSALEAKAVAVAGSGKITNQLSVVPKKGDRS